MKELLKSDSMCKSYAQMKKRPVFFLTHSVDNDCFDHRKFSASYLLVCSKALFVALDIFNRQRLAVAAAGNCV